MKRRAVLAGAPTALLMSGCTDLLSGEEVEFRAETAVVSERARSETGYDEAGIEEDTIEREFEGVDRTVVVVNTMAEYSRSVDIGIGPSGELARFTVLSTPKIDIVPGQPANPIGDMDDEELAERVQNEYDEIQNVERVGEREAGFLGETVEVSVFEAEAATEGEGVDVNIHIAQGESEDDFVIGIAVHPKDIDESDAIDRSLEGVRHPARR